MTTLLPSEVLAKAADLIEPEGAWTQGDFWRLDDGTPWSALDAADRIAAVPSCYCLFGALAAVRGALADPDWARTSDITPYLSRVIRRRRVSGLAAWNDAKRRTQVQVVTALRKASELARSEGQ